MSVRFRCQALRVLIDPVLLRHALRLYPRRPPVFVWVAWLARLGDGFGNTATVMRAERGSSARIFRQGRTANRGFSRLLLAARTAQLWDQILSVAKFLQASATSGSLIDQCSEKTCTIGRLAHVEHHFGGPHFRRQRKKLIRHVRRVREAYESRPITKMFVGWYRENIAQHLGVAEFACGVRKIKREKTP